MQCQHKWHDVPSALVLLSVLAAASLGGEDKTLKDPPDVPNLSGTWQTNYGPLTFLQSGLSLSGSWDQGHEKPGIIKSGSLNPATRTVTFTYFQPWDQASGTATLTLSPDGNQLTGDWSETYPTGGSRSGTWAMSRGTPPPAPAPPTPPRFTDAKLRPTSVGLNTAKPSAMVGEPVAVLVFLRTDSGLAVAADRTYQIALSAEGAEVSPSKVTLNPGDISATARVQSSTPGRETLQASSNEGLQSAQTQTGHCKSGSVQDLVLVASKDHAKADNNDQIEFWVDLTDASGTLTSDGGDKALEFQTSASR